MLAGFYSNFLCYCNAEWQVPSLKSSAEWEYKLARFLRAERYDSERLAFIVHPSVNRFLDLYSGLLNEALYFQSLYKQV